MRRQRLVDLRMRNITCDDDAPRKAQPRFDGVVGERLSQPIHAHIQVDIHNGTAGQNRRLDLRRGHVFLGAVAQVFHEDPVARHFRKNLAIGAAADTQTNRARRAVPGQTDDADLMGEILSTELRADATAAGDFEHFFLPLHIAERVTCLSITGAWKVVEEAAARELDRLQCLFRALTSDNHGNVVRRARGGAEVRHLLCQELNEALWVEHRFCFLVQKALVGAATTLGDEHQLVLVPLRGHNINLRGQIVLRVDFFEHVHGGHLGVAIVVRLVRFPDALGEGLLLVAERDNLLALLAEHNRRARVLARRQDALGGDHGVLEEGKRDELIIRGRFDIIENVSPELKLLVAEKVLDLADGRVGDVRERLGLHDEHVAAGEGGDFKRSRVERQLRVGDFLGVRAELENGGVVEGRGHGVLDVAGLAIVVVVLDRAREALIFVHAVVTFTLRGRRH
eukprot:PhM_4_TR14128/c0_g1_i2/m.90838